ADKIKDSTRQSKQLEEPKVMDWRCFIDFFSVQVYFVKKSICCLGHLLAFSCD
ncbi:unnamed protein product, partial [Brassica napus]